jgi:hypothetical protein
MHVKILCLLGPFVSMIPDELKLLDTCMTTTRRQASCNGMIAYVLEPLLVCLGGLKGGEKV